MRSPRGRPTPLAYVTTTRGGLRRRCSRSSRMQYNAFTHQGKKNNAVREGGYMDYWTLVNLDWENLILMGARGVCVELYAFRLNCFFLVKVQGWVDLRVEVVVLILGGRDFVCCSTYERLSDLELVLFSLFSLPETEKGK